MPKGPLSNLARLLYLFSFSASPVLVLDVSLFTISSFAASLISCFSLSYSSLSFPLYRVSISSSFSYYVFSIASSLTYYIFFLISSSSFFPPVISYFYFHTIISPYRLFCFLLLFVQCFIYFPIVFFPPSP